MIRLLALDLDQTLFGDDLTISPRVNKAITRAQQSGVLVTIVTGREPRMTSKFARELGLTAPIVCAQGGFVYDRLRDEVLHDSRLPLELLPDILAATERYQWNLHFEMADCLYFPRISKHPAIVFESLRFSSWVRVDDFLRDLPGAPHKFIVTLNRPEDRESVRAEMDQALGGQVTIVPSHAYLVEGLPPGVDKGRGLAWLAGHLGIAQEEVMAIGDNDNDVPMLAWAGVGVAMGNASPAAMAVADWVAPSVKEDGVAAAVEKFVP